MLCRCAGKRSLSILKCSCQSTVTCTSICSRSLYRVKSCTNREAAYSLVTRSTDLTGPHSTSWTRLARNCLLYTSDAADDLLCVDLGGRRIIKKKTNTSPIHKPL